MSALREKKGSLGRVGQNLSQREPGNPQVRRCNSES